MKNRIIIALVLIILSAGVKAQPPETTYQGNIAENGYADDASYGPFNIGFNFTFFGNSYNQFYINSNGQVLFGAGSLESVDAPIPTAALPNNFIAPFWDDLLVDSYGKILYTTIGVSPNRKLIVQFTNMGFYPFPVTLGTFSVILYETTNTIQIQYKLIVLTYSDKAHGGSATIGLEDLTGTNGVQYSYHDANAIKDQQAISFTPVAGPSYSTNSNALYDPSLLTASLTLPEPGIPVLLSPAQDAVIGTDHKFLWENADNAASYTLYVGTDPELVGAATYAAGADVSYTVTGLAVDQTYYWAVFSKNATGTSWCEIKRFTTSSTPPLAAIPMTVWLEQQSDKTIQLLYSGGDASAKSAIITSLPAQGQLYQYNAGAGGSAITSVPATVTDAGMNVIYAATGTTGNGAGSFNFKAHDQGGDSPEAVITVNVSPPGVPNILYISRSTNIEIQLDLPMNDPAGKQAQFTVTVNGTPATISSVSLKAGDPNSLLVTLATALTGSESVLISYNAGDITSVKGGLLASFDAQTVTLLSQTITFVTNLTKKYGDPPVVLSAASSSGLGMTYSSSNLPVATISSNLLTINYPGTSDIIARQAGNATYAPAKYIKTLTVAKKDQTITFGALPVKTFGDADFNLSATAGSGLSVVFLSDNPAVATVTGTTVHITGAGLAVITASQSGNSLWNAAPDVQQTLTVNKANQTISFSAIPGKTYGDPDFSLLATATSGLSVRFASDNPAVATVTGSTVHITGAGSAVITASQSGNSSWNAAPDVQQTLTVNKANQTITFSAIPEKNFGDPDFSLSATATSGLSVSFASDNPAVATITGSLIHLTGQGSAIITASQAGNANYNPAPDVTQLLTMGKAGQTITFSALPDKTYGDPDFALSANASSGLTVSYSSDNPAVAIVTGNLIHITGAGTTVITATQAGSNDYDPALPVLQTLTVGKAALTFTAEDKVKSYKAPNPVLTYSVSGFVYGETESVLDLLPSIQTTAVQNSPAGTYPITISGGSDNNYTYNYTAGTLTITKISQTITFTGFPEKLLVGDSYTLTATSTSGLVVLFESSDVSLATVSGDQLKGVSKGNVQIRAYNPGDQNYLAAEAFATVEIYSTHRDIMHLFTPNNDGFNDYWELPEMPAWGRCDVKVFNRWGKMVFSDPDYNNHWDGTSGGNPLPEGPYYFVIKTENSGTVKGTVNIVR